MTDLAVAQKSNKGELEYQPRKGPIEELSDSEALDEINRLVPILEAEGFQTHRAFQRLWYISIAFYVGLQYDLDAFAYEDLDHRLTSNLGGVSAANHIYRIVMGNVARLASAKPDWDVIPRTPDQKDQIGSRVAQRYLDWVYDRFHLRQMQMEDGYWAVTTGNAFVYNAWDHTKGIASEKFRNPFTDKPQLRETMDDDEVAFARTTGHVETKRNGQPDLKILSPFQVHVPHRFLELDRMPWAGFDYLLSYDDIYDRFGRKVANEVEPDEFVSASATHNYYWRLATLAPTLVGGRGHTDLHIHEAIHVRELWRPASGRWPNGLHVIASDKRILYNGPNPFAHDGIDKRYPIIHHRYSRKPGQFWGNGVVEHLIAPQREYNRSREQLSQHRDMLSHPQWLASRQANLGPTRNEYGDIWEFDVAGGEPKLQSPPPLSQTHVYTQDKALYDMQTISAQSEVSQGQVPAGARSGTMVRALQERDDLTIAPAVQELEMAWTQLGEDLLKMASRYISEPEAMEVYGEFRMADIQFFTGEDFNGNTRVRIAAGSMTPKSKVQTQSMMLELMQLGALNPQMDPEHNKLVLEAFEIGGAEDMFLEAALDRRRARLENEAFFHPAPGAPPPDVDEDDDHPTHLKEHLKAKKTDAYEMLAPMVKIAFEAHMMKHKQALAQQVQAQLTMQAMAAGGPGGAGGSPQAKELGEASQPRQRQSTPGAERPEPG